MTLSKGTCKSAFLKGDILHYYHRLINQPIETDKSVTIISQCAPSDGCLGDHNLQSGDSCPLEKKPRTLMKDSLQHCGKDPYQTPSLERTSDLFLTLALPTAQVKDCSRM